MTPVQQIQEILGVTPDGVWGPKSRAALDALVMRPIGGNDDRSEKNIGGLLAPVQPLARALLAKGHEAGLNFKVTSGHRTYEEQANLYADYKAGGPIAARPGYSNHNFGLAFDITEFAGDNKTPIWDGPNYRKMGVIARSLGLFWGGDWTGGSIDEPHFEFRPKWAANLSESNMIAELRRRVTVGQSLV